MNRFIRCLADLFVPLVVVFMLACTAPGLAAPAFAQTPVCGTTATLAFAGSPANLSVVMGIGLSGNSSNSLGTFKDSNALSYTEFSPVAAASTIAFAAAWNAIVTGTPNANYTFSSAGVQGCIYNISGSAAGVYAQTSVLSSGAGTLTNTASVGAGDGLVCAAFDSNSGTGGTPTISNAGTVTADASAPSFRSAHALATAIGSSTCTQPITVGDNVAMVFIDFAAPVVKEPINIWLWQGPILGQ